MRVVRQHLHLREIDALGGEMAKAIDKTGIQFRMLNKSKGPAVWGLRAQADKKDYIKYFIDVLNKQENLELKQDLVIEINVKRKKVTGVSCISGIKYNSKAVIITAGTFLNGSIHIGLNSYPAGRLGDMPSTHLVQSLKTLGLEIGRLKTGTPPRIDKNTIDFKNLIPQAGDKEPQSFSFLTERIKCNQIKCYITHTNEKTYKIVKDNLKKSALYSGKIKGTGPRYCPSIEVKIVRFPEKRNHQIFLEPEGLDTIEYYPNGISTSMPLDIQYRMLRTLKGLEQVKIIRPGYAIEYDFIYPYQIYHTLETKKIVNLYLAGQINGTSGYEEAAAQGLMAGINAVLKLQGKKQIILGRDQAYIGVLIDDIVMKQLDEPYRIFTASAEYRLLLRQDNADLRLTEIGHKAGLATGTRYNRFRKKKRSIDELREYIKNKKLKIERVMTVYQILQSGKIKYRDLQKKYNLKDFPLKVIEEVEIETLYQGYIKIDLKNIRKLKEEEKIKIPRNTNYCNVYGLSREAVEKLEKINPANLSEVRRIQGIKPTDITAILIYLKKK
jgi:tRNA uridine 5-carboxymethylaminomethyl modification enzyme